MLTSVSTNRHGVGGRTPKGCENHKMVSRNERMQQHQSKLI
ncbi:unnamed protein product [Brassica oleracea]